MVQVSKLKDAGILQYAVLGQKEETQRLAEVETRGQQQNISSVYLQTLIFDSVNVWLGYDKVCHELLSKLFSLTIKSTILQT